MDQEKFDKIKIDNKTLEKINNSTTVIRKTILTNEKGEIIESLNKTSNLKIDGSEKIEKMEKVISENEELVDSLGKENFDLKNKMIIYNQKLDLQDSSVSDKEVLTKVENYNLELDEYKKIIKQKDQTIEQLMKNVQNISKEKEKNEYNSQIDQLTSQIYTLQSQLKESSQMLNNPLGQTSSKTMLKAKNEIFFLQKDCKQKEDQLLLLQEAIKQRDKAMKNLISQLNESSQQILQLQNDLKEFKLKEQNWEKEKEEKFLIGLASSSTSLTSESSMESKFEGHEKDLALLRAELDEFYGEEIVRIKERMSDEMTNERRKLKKEINILEKEKEKFENQANKWQEQYILLSEQNISSLDLVKELGSKVTENLRLNQTIDELTLKLSVLSNSSESAQQTGEKKIEEKVLNSLKEELKRLEKMKEEFNVEKELQEKCDLVIKLKEEIVSLKEYFEVEKQEIILKSNDNLDQVVKEMTLRNDEDKKKLFQENERLMDQVSLWQHQYLQLSQQNISSADLVQQISLVVTENIRLNQVVDELNINQVKSISDESIKQLNPFQNQEVEKLRKELEELKNMKNENKKFESLLEKEKIEKEKRDEINKFKLEIEEKARKEHEDNLDEWKKDYEGEVSSLKQLVVQLKQEKDKLVKDCNSWREQYLKLSFENFPDSHSMEKLEIIMMENDKLKNLIKDKELFVDKVKKENEEKNKKIDDLNEIISKINFEKNELIKEKQKIEKFSKNLENDFKILKEKNDLDFIESLKKEIENHKINYLKSEENINILKSKLNSLETVKEELEKIQDQQKLELISNRKVIKNFEEELLRINKDLKTKIKQFEMKENEIETKKNNIEEENIELKKEIKRIMEKHEGELHGRAEVEGIQVEKLKKYYSQNVLELKEEHEKLYEEKNNLIKSFENKNFELNNEIKFLKSDNEKLLKDKNNLDILIQQNDHNYNEMIKKNIENFELEKEKYCQEISKLNNEIKNNNKIIETFSLTEEKNNTNEEQNKKKFEDIKLELKQFEVKLKEEEEEKEKILEKHKNEINDFTNFQLEEKEKMKNEFNLEIKKIEQILNEKTKNNSEFNNKILEENKNYKEKLEKNKEEFNILINNYQKEKDNNLKENKKLREELENLEHFKMEADGLKNLMGKLNGDLGKVIKERDSAINSLQNIYSEKVEMKLKIDKLVATNDALIRKSNKGGDKDRFLALARMNKKPQEEEDFSIRNFKEKINSQNIEPLKMGKIEGKIETYSPFFTDQELMELKEEKKFLELDLGKVEVVTSEFSRQNLTRPIRKEENFQHEKSPIKLQTNEFSEMPEEFLKLKEENKRLKKSKLGLINKLESCNLNLENFSNKSISLKSSTDQAEPRSLSSSQTQTDHLPFPPNQNSLLSLENPEKIPLISKELTFQAKFKISSTHFSSSSTQTNYSSLFSSNTFSQTDLPSLNSSTQTSPSLISHSHSSMNSSVFSSESSTSTLDLLPVLNSQAINSDESNKIISSFHLTPNQTKESSTSTDLFYSFSDDPLSSSFAFLDNNNQQKQQQKFNELILKEDDENSWGVCDEELSPRRVANDNKSIEIEKLRTSLSEANEELSDVLFLRNKMEEEYLQQINILEDEMNSERTRHEEKIVLLKKEVQIKEDKIQKIQKSYEDSVKENEKIKINFEQDKNLKINEEINKYLELKAKHEEAESEFFHLKSCLKKQICELEEKLEKLIKEKSLIEQDFVVEIQKIHEENELKIKGMRENFIDEENKIKNQLKTATEKLFSMEEEIENFQNEQTRQKKNLKKDEINEERIFSMDREETLVMRVHSLQECKAQLEEEMIHLRKEDVLKSEQIYKFSEIIEELKINKLENDKLKNNISSLREDKQKMSNSIEKLLKEKDVLLGFLVNKSQNMELDLSSINLERGEDFNSTLAGESNEEMDLIKTLEAEKELLAKMLEKVSTENKILSGKILHQNKISNEDLSVGRKEEENKNEKKFEEVELEEEIKEELFELKREKESLQLSLESLSLLFQEKQQEIDILNQNLNLLQSQTTLILSHFHQMSGSSSFYSFIKRHSLTHLIHPFPQDFSNDSEVWVELEPLSRERVIPVKLFSKKQKIIVEQINSINSIHSSSNLLPQQNFSSKINNQNSKIENIKQSIEEKEIVEKKQNNLNYSQNVNQLLNQNSDPPSPFQGISVSPGTFGNSNQPDPLQQFDSVDKNIGLETKNSEEMEKEKLNKLKKAKLLHIKKLNEKKNEKNDFNKEIEELIKKNKNLKEQNDYFMKEIENSKVINLKIIEKEEIITKLKEELKNNSEIKIELEKIKNKNLELMRISDEYKKVSEVKIFLESQLKEKEKENNDIKTDNESIKQKISNIQEKLLEKNKNENDKEKYLSDLQEKIEFLKKEKEILTSKTEEKCNEVDGLIDLLNKKKQEVNKKNEEIKTIMILSEEKNEKILKINNLNDQIKKEKEVLEKKLLIFKEIKNYFVSFLKDSKEILIKFNNEKNSFFSEINKKFNKFMKTKEEEKISMTKKINNLKEKIKLKEESFEKNKNKFYEINEEKNKNMNREIENLNNKLKLSENNYEKIEDELKKLEKNMKLEKENSLHLTQVIHEMETKNKILMESLENAVEKEKLLLKKIEENEEKFMKNEEEIRKKLNEEVDKNKTLNEDLFKINQENNLLKENLNKNNEINIKKITEVESEIKLKKENEEEKNKIITVLEEKIKNLSYQQEKDENKIKNDLKEFEKKFNEKDINYKNEINEIYQKNEIIIEEKKKIEQKLLEENEFLKTKIQENMKIDSQKNEKIFELEKKIEEKNEKLIEIATNHKEVLIEKQKELTEFLKKIENDKNTNEKEKEKKNDEINFLLYQLEEEKTKSIKNEEEKFKNIDSLQNQVIFLKSEEKKLNKLLLINKNDFNNLKQEHMEITKINKDQIESLKYELNNCLKNKNDLYNKYCELYSGKSEMERVGIVSYLQTIQDLKAEGKYFEKKIIEEKNKNNQNILKIKKKNDDEKKISQVELEDSKKIIKKYEKEVEKELKNIKEELTSVQKELGNIKKENDFNFIQKLELEKKIEDLKNEIKDKNGIINSLESMTVDQVRNEEDYKEKIIQLKNQIKNLEEFHNHQVEKISFDLEQLRKSEVESKRNMMEKETKNEILFQNRNVFDCLKMDQIEFMDKEIKFLNEKINEKIIENKLLNKKLADFTKSEIIYENDLSLFKKEIEELKEKEKKINKNENNLKKENIFSINNLNQKNNFSNDFEIQIHKKFEENDEKIDDELMELKKGITGLEKVEMGGKEEDGALLGLMKEIMINLKTQPLSYKPEEGDERFCLERTEDVRCENKMEKLLKKKFSCFVFEVEDQIKNKEISKALRLEQAKNLKIKKEFEKKIEEFKNKLNQSKSELKENIIEKYNDMTEYSDGELEKLKRKNQELEKEILTLNFSIKKLTEQTNRESHSKYQSLLSTPPPSPLTSLSSMDPHQMVSKLQAELIFLKDKLSVAEKNSREATPTSTSDQSTEASQTDINASFNLEKVENIPLKQVEIIKLQFNDVINLNSQLKQDKSILEKEMKALKFSLQENKNYSSILERKVQNLEDDLDKINNQVLFDRSSKKEEEEGVVGIETKENEEIIKLGNKNEELEKTLEECNIKISEMQKNISTKQLFEDPNDAFNSLARENSELNHENTQLKNNIERIKSRIQELEFEVERSQNTLNISSFPVQSSPTVPSNDLLSTSQNLVPSSSTILNVISPSSDFNLESGRINDFYSPELRSPASYSSSDHFLASDDGRMSFYDLDDLHHKLQHCQIENEGLKKALNQVISSLGNNHLPAEVLETKLVLTSDLSSSLSSINLKNEESPLNNQIKSPPEEDGKGSLNHVQDLNISGSEISHFTRSSKLSSSSSSTSLNAERFLVRSPRYLVSTSNDYQLETVEAVGKTVEDYVLLQEDFKKFKKRARLEYGKLKIRLVDALKNYHILNSKYQQLSDSITFHNMVDKDLTLVENKSLRTRVTELESELEKKKRRMKQIKEEEEEMEEGNLKVDHLIIPEQKMEELEEQNKLLEDKICQLDLQVSILQSDCAILSDKNLKMENELKKNFSTKGTGKDFHDFLENSNPRTHSKLDAQIQVESLRSDSVDTFSSDSKVAHNSLRRSPMVTRTSSISRIPVSKLRSASSSSLFPINTKQHLTSTSVIKINLTPCKKSVSNSALNLEGSKKRHGIKCKECREKDSQCLKLQKQMMDAEAKLTRHQFQLDKMMMENENASLQASKAAELCRKEQGKFVRKCLKREVENKDFELMIEERRSNHPSPKPPNLVQSTKSIIENVEGIVKKNEKLLQINKEKMKKLIKEYEEAGKEIKTLKMNSLSIFSPTSSPSTKGKTKEKKVIQRNFDEENYELKRLKQDYEKLSNLYLETFWEKQLLSAQVEKLEKNISSKRSSTSVFIDCIKDCEKEVKELKGEKERLETLVFQDFQIKSCLSFSADQIIIDKLQTYLSSLLQQRLSNDNSELIFSLRCQVEKSNKKNEELEINLKKVTTVLKFIDLQADQVLMATTNLASKISCTKGLISDKKLSSKKKKDKKKMEKEKDVEENETLAKLKESVDHLKIIEVAHYLVVDEAKNSKKN